MDTMNTIEQIKTLDIVTLAKLAIATEDIQLAIALYHFCTAEAAGYDAYYGALGVLLDGGLALRGEAESHDIVETDMEIGLLYDALVSNQ